MDNTMNDKIEKILTNPAIGAASQMHPLLAAAHSSLITSLTNIQNERREVFMDELSRGKIRFEDKIAQSDPFVHCFIITYDAAMRSLQRQKNQYFAHLLSSSFESSELYNVTEYEEYLNMLNETSSRELWILVVLSKYEKKHRNIHGKLTLKEVSIYWDAFIAEISSKLSISSEEINAILTRLNKSGLYSTIVGSYVGYYGDRGTLTPIYYKLEDLIKPIEGDFIDDDFLND
ncbi:hypothetical protein [uncultured Methanolobus sp.]|uniref:hypothetical protein n=1 Tax=uncultured Methanolobus sp. TaxID=218300 RepID=UPI002AAC2456|nr:hypothetical protein [uncultured Methanolobus sp.]